MFELRPARIFACNDELGWWKGEMKYFKGVVPFITNQSSDFISFISVLPVPLISRMCPSDTYRVWKSGKFQLYFVTKDSNLDCSHSAVREKYLNV